MKKQKQNVPVATEEKPIEPEPENTSVPVSPEVPKDPLTEWMKTVDARFAVAEANFKQIGEFLTRIEPLAKLGDQITAKQNNPEAQIQPQPQGGIGGLGGLLQILPQILGGGSPDSELAQLGKDALKSQIAMSTAITNAVVSKITGKAVAEVAEVVSS